jgi:1-acyl-sn-glycerol-3-phosphate acyltransferase
MPVARGGADRRAVQAIAATLRSGNAVMIFPEGTRTSDGELQEPKTGIGWLAANIEDSLILPVYIAGTYGIWSRHRKYPGRGRVEIHIGKPVRPSELVPALAQLKSATRNPASHSREDASDGEKENLPGGAKKRLYWELAVEIMGQIAKVKEETSR